MISKFRAWDKDNKKMIAVKSIHFMDDNSDYCIVTNPMEFISSEHLSLMQATGLEDAHGNMIYVGDIINVYSRWFSHPNLVVKFEQGSLLVEKDNVFELLYSVSCDSEIVGNIYENSELLKEKLNGKSSNYNRGWSGIGII